MRHVSGVVCKAYVVVSQAGLAGSDPMECDTCPGAVNQTGYAVDALTEEVAAFCSANGECGWADTPECACALGYAGEVRTYAHA